MFLGGVETLLTQHSGVEIVGSGIDEDSAVECIERCNPDVILLNCDDPDPDLSPAVLCVLRKRPGSVIIGLSLKDNTINIYRGEDKQVLQVDDLLNAILR